MPLEHPADGGRGDVLGDLGAEREQTLVVLADPKARGGHLVRGLQARLAGREQARADQPEGEDADAELGGQ